MLTHKRGSVLHRLGMLEYRAFELTQTNLAVLASQHLPNSMALVNKDRFEAPDLLLPSMQKLIPLVNGSSIPTVTLTGEPAEEILDDDENDYGEEYDDTRTFTVKDFKE